MSAETRCPTTVRLLVLISLILAAYKLDGRFDISWTTVLLPLLVPAFIEIIREITAWWRRAPDPDKPAAETSGGVQ